MSCYTFTLHGKVCTNDEFSLVYHFKVFDESFIFLSKEKNIQNLETVVAAFASPCLEDGPMQKPHINFLVSFPCEMKSFDVFSEVKGT